MSDRFFRFRAWLVHLYTGLSIPLSFYSLIEIQRGNIQMAWIFNLVNVLIDSSDGTLARKFQVKKWLPDFDGGKLDDIADFLTYVVVPLYLVYHCHLVPEPYLWCLSLPLMASGYGFCQGQAKTEDGFFTGFPSYWNILVFYLYLLAIPPVWNLILLVVCAILVFVPIKYLYPSRARSGKFWLISFGILWGIALLYFIYQMEATPKLYIYVSLLYPAYYTLYSLFLNLKQKK